MVSKELISIIDKFFLVCKDRGFHKETVGVLGVMAGSKEAITVFGNTLKAYQKLVEISKTCSKEQELVEIYTDLIKA